MPKRTGPMADFAAMLDSQLKSYRSGFNPGDRVTARVRSVGRGYAVLDVNAKNEGLLPLETVTDGHGNVTVAAGDEMEVAFTGMDRDAFMFAPAAKAVAAAPDSAISDAMSGGLPVEGRVEKEVKGGYEVAVGGRRAFCPYSQIDLHRREGAVYTGLKLNFLVTEYSTDDRGETIVLSRRALLEREAAENRSRLMSSIEEGQTLNGKVTRLADFGIFVDVGGMEGLVPLRELSRITGLKPEEVAKPGDTVTVRVLSTDWDRNRISLSIKACQPDPWDDAVARFPAGTEFTGRVRRIMPFGAFVGIVPGVDGLIPVGRLGAGRHLATPAEVLSEGQEIAVRVDAVDNERRRISLRPVAEPESKKAAAEKAAGEKEEEAVDVEEWLAKNSASPASAGLGSLAGAFDGLKL